MTENGFWNLLAQKRQGGLVDAVVGRRMTEDGGMGQMGDYMEGHAGLPKDYDKLSQEEIIGMGKLLFQKDVIRKTKEMILLFLAHQDSMDALFFLREYNKRPEKNLSIFAEMALSESLMWNGVEDDSCGMKVF